MLPIWLLLASFAAGRAAGVGEPHFEQQLTSFSPQGRLYQVEYAQVAAEHQGTPTVAVRGRRSVVVASRSRALGPLAAAGAGVAGAPQRVHRLGAGLGCCASGVAGDEVAVVRLLRAHALDFRKRYGYDVPLELLSLWLADYNRAAASGEAEHRPLAATALIFGAHSLSDGREVGLYRVEPSGQFYRCRGACLGPDLMPIETATGGAAGGTAEEWLAAELAQSGGAALGDPDDEDSESEEGELVGHALRCLARLVDRLSESRSGEGGEVDTHVAVLSVPRASTRGHVDSWPLHDNGKLQRRPRFQASASADFAQLTPQLRVMSAVEVASALGRT